jgi:hypothetical protein
MFRWDSHTVVANGSCSLSFIVMPRGAGMAKHGQVGLGTMQIAAVTTLSTETVSNQG